MNIEDTTDEEEGGICRVVWTVAVMSQSTGTRFCGCLLDTCWGTVQYEDGFQDWDGFRAAAHGSKLSGHQPFPPTGTDPRAWRFSACGSLPGGRLCNHSDKRRWKPGTTVNAPCSGGVSVKYRIPCVANAAL